jgi:membrane protease YdiL (CAAX protease family)
LLSLPVIIVYFTSDSILAIIAIIFLVRSRWWQTIGLRKPRRLRELWFFVLPLVAVADNLSGGIQASAPGSIATFCFLAALVGFVEETYLRGFMLHPIALRGPWRGVLITAVLFGLLHSLNILIGWNPQAVISQIGFAFAVGFCYAALRLRTGLIWPLMILHFLTDFSAFLALNQITMPQSSGVNVFATLVYVIIFAGYGAIVLATGRRSVIT